MRIIEQPYVYDLYVKVKPGAVAQVIQRTSADANFCLKAIEIVKAQFPFAARFSGPDGYLYNSFLDSSHLPLPMNPAMIVPAGGFIGVDIQDTTNCGGDRRRRNRVTLRLWGSKQFAVEEAA
jgi:hypothetical protein